MAKVKFTRENIVNATYDLMKQEGMKNISARKIAKKLKGSTAPIYAHFSNLEILKEEVIEIAKSNFSKYVNKEYTEREMLNIAMGIAVFAREERELFKSIFLMDDDFKDLFDVVVKDVVEKSKDDERFEGFNDEKIEKIILQIWYYVHGYSTLICTVFLRNQTNEKIQQKILELTTIVIGNNK
ncbi:MAG: TetR/AcrR family transcriptional regulator [Leptotrichiaceae bacterium]